MGLWSYLRALDYDKVFSYDTVKIVRIKDKRLGILHYLFLFGIILYILFYTVLWEKKYLLTETPTGSFRISLMQAPEPLPFSELPYCLQNQPEYLGFANYECRYWNEAVVVFPITEENAMLAASRITVTNFSASCDFTTPDCKYQNTSDPEIYYIADLERFTLMIDHAFYATNLDIQRNGQQLNGKLLDIEGNEMELESPNQIGQEGDLDIVELGVLLKAANATPLDEYADVDNTRLEDARTVRYTGVILLVIIDYSNTGSFNSSDVDYTVTVRQINKSQFKSEQQIFSTMPTEYSEWNRHGIRLLFQRTGTIGKFDFQTLLINIIAGAALVSLSTVAVDILAVYLLPQKAVYGNFKYEPTPDIDELNQALNHVGDESQPLLTNSEKKN